MDEMHEVGQTLDFNFDFIPVFECSVCGCRTRYEGVCSKCKNVREWHEEEFVAGVL